MSDPVVTVVMPAYRAERFIAEAVRSVLAQTFRDFELFVADDASDDATVRVANEAAGGDARVRILRLPHGGPGRARNAAIREARGRVMAFLDADDAYEPEHLARLVEGLAAHPGHFVYSNATVVGDGAEGPSHYPGYVPATSFRDLYLVSHIPSPGAIAVRADDVRAVGGFIEAPIAIGSEDRGLYLALCARGVTPVYLPHKGLRYRVHRAQLTRRSSAQLRAKLEVRKRFRDAKDPITGERLISASDADPLLGGVAYDLAYALLGTNRAEADATYAEALGLDPAIATDGRGLLFDQKKERIHWISWPDPRRLPALSARAAALAATWAVLVLGLYVAARFLAHDGMPRP